MATINEALAIALEHHRSGRRREAELVYREILKVDPDQADALYLLGSLDQEAGRLDEAAERYQCAVRVRPEFFEAHLNLGVALVESARREEAADCFRRAIKILPDDLGALCNLGNVLREQGRLEEAAGCLRRALRTKPDHVDALVSLGNVLRGQGRLDEAADCYRAALRVRPDFAIAQENLLLCAQYEPGITPERLADLHAAWDAQYAAPLRVAWRAHENTREPDRPLRLGFVSADFRQHPVGFFLIGVLENLPRDACSVACYSNQGRTDALTARFRAAAGQWRQVDRLSDQALAEHIRADRIDILFDLAGHTSGNRLLALARKPAPIQVTWIGYEGTTGMAAIDYLLAGATSIPAGQEASYREKVLRLPEGYVCFTPPDYAPDVSPLPALSTGAVTLGSLNHPAKLNREVVSTWAEILRRVPGARLLLKYHGLDCPATLARFRDWFVSEGVEPSRLEFEGHSPHAESLAAYQRIDLALDPFPFSGSATTCDALWMGVPVVTWPGATFAGRHSAGHLAAVGLSEFVAGDRAGYIALAEGWARQPDRLARLRSALRPRMSASSLCDAPRLARHLAQLLRMVWRDWCGVS